MLVLLACVLCAGLVFAEAVRTMHMDDENCFRLLIPQFIFGCPRGGLQGKSSAGRGTSGVVVKPPFTEPPEGWAGSNLRFEPPVFRLPVRAEPVFVSGGSA